MNMRIDLDKVYVIAYILTNNNSRFDDLEGIEGNVAFDFYTHEDDNLVYCRVLTNFGYSRTADYTYDYTYVHGQGFLLDGYISDIKNINDFLREQTLEYKKWTRLNKIKKL